MTLPISKYAAVLLQAARMFDKRFRVTSLYRSPAAQQRLYVAWLKRGKTGLPAAPPGHSMHELGEAVDIARGVDPFHDQALAELGAWWKAGGLGWSSADPVHFQLQPIPEHAAGLAAGERATLRAPMPRSAAEAPINHPSVVRGLADLEDSSMAPQLPGSLKLGEPSMANIPEEIVKKAGAAAAAALATGGGFAGAAAAAESALAAVPAAAPVAVAAIIGGIMAEHWDDLWSGKIDPVFDATTAEGIARSRRQALLIKQDLAESGYKFARKTGVL